MVRIERYPPTRQLPHDLAHFVVEDTLDIQYGFWANISRGYLLRGMHVDPLDAGTAPSVRATPNIEQDVANSESLVAALRELIADGLEQQWPEVPRALEKLIVRRGARLAPLTKSDLSRVANAWRTIKTRWDALPVGRLMQIEWVDRRTSGSWPIVTGETPVY